MLAETKLLRQHKGAAGGTDGHFGGALYTSPQTPAGRGFVGPAAHCLHKHVCREGQGWRMLEDTGKAGECLKTERGKNGGWFKTERGKDGGCFNIHSIIGSCFLV